MRRRISATFSLVAALVVLSVEASAQTKGIAIDWLEAAGPVVGYDVYVEINGGATNFYRSVSEARADVNGSQFQVGDALRFQVVGFAADGHRSPPSDYSSLIFFVRPPTPQAVVAVDGSQFGPISLYWNPVEHLTSYVVFRSTSPGVTGNVVGRTSVPFFEDLTAAADVDYYYSVAAVSGRQASRPSEQVTGRLNENEPALTATPRQLSYTSAPQQASASQTVEIRNAGDRALSYSLWGSARWLRVSPSMGGIDRETDTLTFTYSLTSLPEGESRTFVWIYPFYSPPDGGPSIVGTPLEIEVVVNVSTRNRAPVLEPTPSAVEVAEGQVVSIPIRATDPDPGDRVRVGVGSMVGFMSFDDFGNGEGLLTIAPGFDAAGTYPLLLVAFDFGVPQQLAFADLVVTVTNRNRQPFAASIPPTTIRPGVTTRIAVTAFDPDVGDRLAITTSPLPAFATFRDFGNGTGEFTFAPTTAHLGTYMIVAAIVDSGSPPMFMGLPFQITVAE